MTAPRPKAMNSVRPSRPADRLPVPARLITRKQLAERLGVSERTVMRMEESGHLPPPVGSACAGSGTGRPLCPASPDEKKTRRRARTGTPRRGRVISHRPILP